MTGTVRSALTYLVTLSNVQLKNSDMMYLRIYYSTNGPDMKVAECLCTRPSENAHAYRQAAVCLKNVKLNKSNKKESVGKHL